ncbi:hypothetical protein C900_05948 [Fulvivirga imtechensis AK7]|uniref:Uncharacterized protein n=1 Tax=Fulvivirga imtechensis AK7 TaxID=1237149 RepID=L8JIN3_9BACT|nr:hypothetical protein [Fulvivirga imtechensis]ELR68685.1 hypothetical protein C900_05948 [Fulvivirga imtechensis AK7]
MKKSVRIFSYVLIVLVILFYILPNIFNTREEKAFSSEARVEKAMAGFDILHVGDSTNVVLSEFYDRGPFIRYLFGKHYRDLWSREIKVPVLHLDTVHGGLEFLEMGGGQQTVSAEFRSHDGYTYTLRSVDKDQAQALPLFLRYSAIRPLFRDQAAALNPFAALIAHQLEEKAGILHTQPRMYLIPYDSTMNETPLYHVAGRVMILEEEPDSTWVGNIAFASPQKIISSKEMLSGLSSNELTADSLEYLKCRLLDMLMSDWDRHGGQWKWAVFSNSTGQSICRPIAMDRDMAFYQFNDGLMNKFALLINNKFQSFDRSYGQVSGLAKNSAELDAMLLKNIPLRAFTQQSLELQKTFTDTVIQSAFKAYPQGIYDEYGHKHANIFKDRLHQLDSIAVEFYKLTKGNRKP